MKPGIVDIRQNVWVVLHPGPRLMNMRVKTPILDNNPRDDHHHMVKIHLSPLEHLQTQTRLRSGTKTTLWSTLVSHSRYHSELYR